MLALIPVGARAQDGLFDYQEFEKRVKSAQGLAALAADSALGDRTSSFDGATEFSVDDVSLPGNFDLPVKVSRRFSVESANRAVDGSEATGLTLFDNWEIDVPSISGVWTNGTGWVTNSNGTLTTQRCSVNVAPQLIEGHGYYNVGFGLDVKWAKGASENLLIPEGAEYANAPGLDPAKWIAASRARFTCLASTRNGYPGEGFIGHTTDGRKYFFDWGVEKPYAVGKYGDGSVTRTVGRKRVYLLASRIEDRYGNWVSYGYTGYRLDSITASDGRSISLAYDGQGRVSTVTANGRVWRYAYASDTADNDAGLAKVTLPDGSSWTYSHTGHLRSRLPFRGSEGSAGGCEYPGGSVPRPVSMTVTSPSGATGVFDFEMNMFLRSDPCDGLVPSSYDAWSLKQRTITGPGLQPQITRRSYNLTGTGLPGVGRWVSTVQPDGVEIRERYGTDPGLDERKRLQRQVISAAGQLVRDETTSYIYGSSTGPFAQRIGRSLGIMSGQFLDGTLSAVSETTVQQDGDTYQTIHAGFDRNARASMTTRSGPMGSRSEQVQYYDSATPWVQDQIAKKIEYSTGTVINQYEYNAMAKPSVFWKLGRIEQRIAYATDGTVSLVQDALGNVTDVTSWHRGIPRLLTNPDGTTRSMSVDDNGWIMSQTNEAGFTTAYTYDEMGRTRELIPPVDTNQWQKTTIAVRQVADDEYGLGAGHWRVDNTRGAYRQETYLDALWRPILVRTYDNSDLLGTQTFIRKSFDAEGREVFASFPSRSSDPTSGIWTEYDALGRTTSSSQDSEKGLLINTRAFGANTTVIATDPRGHQSITRYEAFGAPEYERPVQITRPDGSKQTTVRNVFGLPTEISQSAN